MTNELTTVCPLCAFADRHESADSLSGQELWDTLDARLTPSAWGPLSEDLKVTMYSCNNCRFEFFDSRLAGNAAFYAELQHEDYYTFDRPEFRGTLAFAEQHSLQYDFDVGCGTGEFLDLAKRARLETSGVELTSSAAEPSWRSSVHVMLQRPTQ